MMDTNGSFAEGYAIGRDSNNGNNGNGYNNGFGGEWLWAIILLACLWGGFGNGNGWGNNGNGNGMQFLPYAVGANGALTRSDLCSEFAFNDLQNAVRGVQQGICDSTFALNNSITGGFAGVNSAICNIGYEQAQLSNATNMAIMQGNNALQSQLASCCCDNRTGQMQIINSIDSNACQTGRAIERGFCDTNYALATNTTAIIQNAHNDTDRVIAKLDAMEMSRKDETIAALRSQVESLNLAQSQANQNNYLVNTLRPCPVPTYLTCNPWAAQAPYGSCGGCGGNQCCG